MTTPHLYQSLARYNQLMNAKIYDVCAGIPDADRRVDRGAFFGSVHSTLNHILYGDKAWIGRLRGPKDPLPPIGTDLHEDFNELRFARAAMDTELIGWTDSLTADWLNSELEWTSGVDGRTRGQARWLLTLHMFNHQTHHRGQLTTLLSQLGLDVGSTDLPMVLTGAA